jgi:hypothetical protein
MGLGDFMKGIGEAGGKALDVATDALAGSAMDKYIDIATEPVERLGQGLTAAGKGVNWAADQTGKMGDQVQKWSDAAGLPSPVGSALNFASGGGTQWVGRSVGDLGQTAGFLGQNIDTATKGINEGINFASEHPGETGALIGKGADYAMNHKMDIAKGVGKAALDEATDPASLALMVATGGGSAALKSGLSAGATAAAEGGLRAGARAAATAAGETLLRGGGKAVAGEIGEEVVENVGESAIKTGMKNAAVEGADQAVETLGQRGIRSLVKDSFSGRNLASGETPGVLGKVDRALEFGLRKPGNGMVNTFRRGLAERVASTGEGGLFREVGGDILANKLTPGNLKPSFGGEAAENAWRVERGMQKMKRADQAKDAVDIARDPTSYAMKRFGPGDTRTAMSNMEAAEGPTSSASVTGDLVQPTMTTSRVGYTNSYGPRGFTTPGVLPARGQADLTTGQSTPFEVKDPYAEGGEYGSAETSYQVHDPYKPLTQPKKQNDSIGAYA